MNELDGGRGARKGAGLKLEILIKMVGLLPRDGSAAITAEELRGPFFSQGPRATEITRASQLTALRRYLGELRKHGLVKELPPLQGMDRLPRYHLIEHRLYSYFMHGKVALGLHWTTKLLAPLSDGMDDTDLGHMASKARLSRREEVIRDRVRVVPDGIGRSLADVKRDQVRTVFEALAAGQMVLVEYTKRTGEHVQRELSVLGLAQKDGTVYLIASLRLGGKPIHYAMHRVKSVALLPRRPADTRPDFDIDAYIESQHQLAHVRDDRPSPLSLELLVHEKALFHFRERPLLPAQSEPEAYSRDGWYRVTATVPNTDMLVPYLWSHAPWVEVLGPPSVRDDVAVGIRTAAAFYDDYKSGGEQ
jgi:predicted DNA-binding transcriptional regulator YafY